MSTLVVSQRDDLADDAIDRTLKRGHEEIATPTTPRPPTSQAANAAESRLGITERTPSMSQDNTTVSRAASSSDAAPSAAPSSQENHRGTLYRGSSQSSLHSSAAVDDMDVDASDGDQDGSDNDTENGDGERSSKKKKGQKFFCTDFPPCNLSFTRSEHLARHIRKHTGERPFQCHCNRRFSRLDNLRQHAQTVHVNEEIPGDSLAATGTRFQRQIRTDRVRPAGGRPRSGTAGSPSGHGRAHSRNLSTSSVGSTASNYSMTPEPRRRPPPLIMANDGRPKLSLDPPNTPPAQYRAYQTHSPGGFSTPTSTTYSNVPGSPSYGANMESPSPNVSRSASFFDPPTSARRLSVPSSANPYQAPYGAPYPQSYPSTYGPPTPVYSSQSSAYASPTASTFPTTRMDNNIIPADDWRRRTWHASTYTAMGLNYSRPATSGLTYSQTPDAPQPAFAQHATVAAGHAPRLPGIESFDQVQHRPSTPPRRQLSPMRVESGPAGHIFVTPNAPIRDHRRAHQSLDMALNNNLTRLDIHGPQPKELNQWGQETMTEIHNATSRPAISANFGQPGQSGGPMLSGQPALQPPAEISNGAPSSASQRIKRHGWYNGPTTATRTSPEDSSSSEGVPTPGTSAAEIHPAIMHSSGFIEPHHPVLASDGSVNPCIPQQQSVASFPSSQSDGPPPLYYSSSREGGNDMGRLEALVAVATSEDKATTAAR